MSRIDEALKAVERESEWRYRGHRESVDEAVVPEPWHEMVARTRRTYGAHRPGPGYGYLGEIEA